jgi:hypothetical protein
VKGCVFTNDLARKNSYTGYEVCARAGIDPDAFRQKVWRFTRLGGFQTGKCRLRERAA